MTIPTLLSDDFHAHHSPLGAYASFTCGRHGVGGGLSIAGVAPPAHQLLIGWADDKGSYVLPFATEAAVDLDNYAEAEQELQHFSTPKRSTLDAKRVFRASSDSWVADGFRFSIHTPVESLPDPEVDGEGVLLQRLLPAIVCELELDNSAGTDDADVFFAIRPDEVVSPLEPNPAAAKGVQWQRRFAIAAVSDEGVESWVHWDELEYLAERREHRLGGMAGLSRRVPKGEKRVLKVILAFHQAGIVTAGLEGSYYYGRRYSTLASVVDAAAASFDGLVARSNELDEELSAAELDDHQRFLIAHSERSYWGNTQMLDIGGKPVWMVYEGEYAMMNTFDLSVDQCFYEMRRNPWVVRNICDQFANRYSYMDRLARPADDAAERANRVTMCRDPHMLHQLVPEPVETGLPGGISFCHDMGVAQYFTPAGDSSYELSRLAGCFSYMTCEQLYNWICTAGTYVLGTDDQAWLERRKPVFLACLDSLLNRDDPDPSLRNGRMGLDSSRCDGGWEITTYDSLDHSLGQARNNLYMAVKGWASCIALEMVFGRLGELKRQVLAADAARRAAQAVVSHFDTDTGFIPAVFEAGNSSAIIPAIEGLVFPLVWKNDSALDPSGPYGDMITILGKHLDTIMDQGLCLFEDGGWKLSSTADNSWCSKIFICQHVADRVYHKAPKPESHAAHARWQQVGSADWAMSDQCVAGVGKGSRYYPRCVTNDLWLEPRNG